MHGTVSNKLDCIGNYLHLICHKNDACSNKIVVAITKDAVSSSGNNVKSNEGTTASRSGNDPDVCGRCLVHLSGLPTAR